MKYETLSKEEITSVINNKPIVKNGKTNGNNSESITHFNSENREDLHVRWNQILLRVYYMSQRS